MAPAVLNGFYNLYLKQVMESDDYTITVTNQPLPRSIDEQVRK